jgi:hypothetical protein
MTNPLVLRDHELRAVNAAAELLPEHQRTTFTRNVAVLFATRGDLVEAIRMGLASLGVARQARVHRRARPMSFIDFWDPPNK